MALNTNEIVINTSVGEILWGSETVDGSWKIKIVSNNFEIQKREAGVWVPQSIGLDTPINYNRIAIFQSNFTTGVPVASDAYIPRAFENELYNDTNWSVGGVMQNHCILDTANDPTGGLLYLAGGFRWFVETWISGFFDRPVLTRWSMSIYETLPTGSIEVPFDLSGKARPSNDTNNWCSHMTSAHVFDYETPRWVQIWILDNDITYYRVTTKVLMLGPLHD
jgi:hypothetical protein